MPTSSDVPSESFQAVAATLDGLWASQSSAEFGAALRRLRILAENADLDACEYLAEILATSPTHRDVAAAYKWYYIALSQQGYSVEFRDLNGMPPKYGGPDGDFRNEAQVSSLVDELGFQLAKELDSQAAAWLRARHLTIGSSDRGAASSVDPGGSR
jgi:hypothetical protein